MPAPYGWSEDGPGARRQSTALGCAFRIHTQIAYTYEVEFVEAPEFTALMADYLDDDEYRGLQGFLAGKPAAGDVMPGTGGFRKLRWADPRRRKGKRGGLRVIYYYLEADDLIWLITVYDKNEMADLSPGEKRLLKKAIEAELAQRAGRRSRRRK
jgi:mRNA-degrading endonuclease RelE of RelBE toxin-antitoxin system